MQYLLTASEMKKADDYTSDYIGIPSIVLMERAALCVAEEIRRAFPDPACISVTAACGKGNNGADAVAAGRILIDWGYNVHFVFTAVPELKTKDMIKTNMDIQMNVLHQYGLTAEPFEAYKFENRRTDAVIDGIFGTGLSRDVSGTANEMIVSINRIRTTQGTKVFSVDIPSGISSDTGKVMGCAVQADCTVALAFYKRGHFLFPGHEYCGETVLRKIGITERSFEKMPVMFTYDTESAAELLPERTESGNKGTFGKLLIIAGSINVSGAAVMSAAAAYRSGCGMVKVFTPNENRVIIQTTVPEALLTTYPNEIKEAESLLKQDLQWCDTILIGPGLGRNELGKCLLKTVLDTKGKKGIVIDADAIRLIADYDLYDILKEAGESSEIILTPHMAECSALLKCSISDLKEEPVDRVRGFSHENKVVLLCKDARSYAAEPGSDRIYLNTSGNSALAKAGSGDILAGVAGSFLAQGMSGFKAACAASYLHGKAAQVMTDQDHLAGKRSVMAMDIAEVMKELRI